MSKCVIYFCDKNQTLTDIIGIKFNSFIRISEQS